MEKNKYILNISYFNEIVKGIKAMKSDLVCIYNNLLIGTDNSMTNLKVYNLGIEIPIIPITIITKELSTEFYKNIIDTEIVFDLDIKKIYAANNKSYVLEKNPMINTIISTQIIYRYNQLLYDTSKSKIVPIGDITSSGSFLEYRSMKAADGARMYVPEGYFDYGMYLYSGAINVNSSDKVDLVIYDNYDVFTSKFIVYKKKLNPVEIYFKFIKIRY